MIALILFMTLFSANSHAAERCDIQVSQRVSVALGFIKKAEADHVLTSEILNNFAADESYGDLFARVVRTEKSVALKNGFAFAYKKMNAGERRALREAVQKYVREKHEEKKSIGQAQIDTELIFAPKFLRALGPEDWSLESALAMGEFEGRPIFAGPASSIDGLRKMFIFDPFHPDGERQFKELPLPMTATEDFTVSFVEKNGHTYVYSAKESFLYDYTAQADAPLSVIGMQNWKHGSVVRVLAKGGQPRFGLTFGGTTRATSAYNATKPNDPQREIYGDNLTYMSVGHVGGSSWVAGVHTGRSDVLKLVNVETGDVRSMVEVAPGKEPPILYEYKGKGYLAFCRYSEDRQTSQLALHDIEANRTDFIGAYRDPIFPLRFFAIGEIPFVHYQTGNEHVIVNMVTKEDDRLPIKTGGSRIGIFKFANDDIVLWQEKGRLNFVNLRTRSLSPLIELPAVMGIHTFTYEKYNYAIATTLEGRLLLIQLTASSREVR